MALIGQAVSEKKIFENCGRRTDGRTTEHGYTISSPCEPDGSGELKMVPLVDVTFKVLPVVPMVPMLPMYADKGYVRGSPSGKICKSTNGTVGTIFTNGNQKTLYAFLLPMVPLIQMVPTVPLVDLQIYHLDNPERSHWMIVGRYRQFIKFNEDT